MLPLLHIAIALLLALAITLQQRMAGLASSFGGSGTYIQRRGAELLLYQATIVLAALFFALAIVRLFI